MPNTAAACPENAVGGGFAARSTMHILLISRCPPYPLHLGDRLIVYHLARLLAARGHTLDLLTFDDRPDLASNPADYAHLFHHIALFAQPQRSPFDLLKRASIRGARFARSAAAAGSPAMWRAIQRQVASTYYDLVHVFGGVSVYEYRGAFEHLPALITPYESYALYLARQRAAAPMWKRPVLAARQQIARHFERFMFTPYAATVVVSEPDRAELLKANSALEVRVIPNGVDLAYFQPAYPEKREPATLLFTGNFEYPPNIDAALHLATTILPAVQARIPSARLWLVGSKPPPALQALASDAITVTGHVPDLRPYLARAALFACPLRFGAGIKNKVLEAMAMQCPVVASPLSFDGIVAKHGRDAIIAPPETLAAPLIELLQSPERRRLIGANGRRLVEERYSWQKVAADYEALYHEVLAQRNAQPHAGRMQAG
ncbi:MAG: glycosyltransferase [Aggregatilineales bacterium]